LRRNAKDKKTAVLLAVFFSILLISSDNLAGQTLQALDREISQIVDQISGSVAIVEARPHEDHGPVFPGQARSMSRPVNAVVGSGLLIDSLGHVLTCLGLVDGYDEFRVELHDRVFNAVPIGVDRRLNLAVLKIDTVFDSFLELSPFPPLAGRMALAYGHSINHTGYPVLGIIAGRQSDGSYLVSGTVLPGLLGGGVFDLSGKLMGIISSGNVTVNDYRGAWGGMVMLPASVAYAAADRIICCGNREAGYLGIHTTAIELVSPSQKILGEAVAISEVDPGSPAAAAGLREGDIVTRIAYRPVTNDRELQRLVSSAGADSTISIEFMRGPRRLNIAISLTSAPQQSFTRSAGPMVSSDRQTQLAIELQKRIDSMRVEMQRLEMQLEHLIGHAGTAR